MEENKIPVTKQKKIFIAVFISCILIMGVCLSLFLINKIRDSHFNDALSDVTKVIKSGFPGTNSIETSGHDVYIKIWTDGVFEASKKAAEGNETALKNWNELRDNIYLLVSDICEVFRWADDATIFFSLVSDKNTDSELIVYKNKTLVYDGVYEYLNQNGG